MPQGVEHETLLKDLEEVLTVKLSLMPQGVEHQIMSGETGHPIP